MKLQLQLASQQLAQDRAAFERSQVQYSLTHHPDHNQLDLCAIEQVYIRKGRLYIMHGRVWGGEYS